MFLPQKHVIKLLDRDLNRILEEVAGMRKEGRAKVLSAADLAKACLLQRDKPTEKRNVALLYISYFTGLRSKEMAGLILEDVLTVDRQLQEEITLRSSTTKGGKIRLCYLSNPKLREALSAYLEEREDDNLKSPLFLSQKGGAFSPNSMQQLFSTIYQKEVGLEGCTSHSGRRTFATRVLNSGANIKELQILMGHSSINTTAIYVQEDPERLSSLVRRLK